MASALIPNLQGGFTITACLPTSPALFTSELLARRVVPVSFNRSTVVEGTVCPTAAASLDANIHDILVAGLEKAKIQIKICKLKTKVLDCKSTSYLPVARSLRGALTLPHSRASTCWMTRMSIFASTGTMCPVIIPARFRSFCIFSFIIRTKAFYF